jgi:hypothetical protein
MSRVHRHILCLGLTVGVLALAVSLSGVASDVLTQFRLTQEEAEDELFETLWRGRPAGFAAASAIFRTMTPQARAAAVTAAAAVVRTYGESDAFRARYARQRQAERPATAPKTTSAADIDKSMADAGKALDEMQAALKDMPPEMRKMMEAAMKQAGAESTDIEGEVAKAKKDMKTQAAEQKAAQAKAEAAAEERAKSAAEFDVRYPANPETFIARRLREFLDLTATVPAEGALVRRGGKRVFVDPALEKKPEYWKQLYRAGQPSVDAARTAATAWLKALDGKGGR